VSAIVTLILIAGLGYLVYSLLIGRAAPAHVLAEPMPLRIDDLIIAPIDTAPTATQTPSKAARRARKASKG
jgi:hypothetical protein